MSGPAASGPYRVGTSVLCCALPVLTLGLLGMVPSTVLAVGRRRPVDIAGAVVFGVLQLTLYVSAALAPKAGGSVWDTFGTIVVLPMWIGAPVHFLLMNRRSMWPAPKPSAQPYPQPFPAYPQQQAVGYPPQASPYPQQTVGYPQQAAPYLQQTVGHPQQQAAAHPAHSPYPQPYPHPVAQPAQHTYGYPPAGPTPAPGAPAPAPSATGEELRELGELLRRQAQEGRP